jgi:uncharacterized protein (DUF983 family)
MVGDTKPLSASKCCSKCGEEKTLDRIVKNRNVCKDCVNVKKKENYQASVIDNEIHKICNICSITKHISSFIKCRNICKDCANEKRRNKYKTDENHRLKVIKQASEFKHNKVVERRTIKLEEIGEGNKQCSTCSEIKSKIYFRHNRLKCKNCERDDPVDKFKRYVRCRIYSCLKKNKKFHTDEYLGCTSQEYLNWMLSYDENYNLKNLLKNSM